MKNFLNIINNFKNYNNILNKIVASLIIFSIASGVCCFSAESNNNLDNASVSTITNQTDEVSQGTLSELKNTLISIFSNALQKIKNFFSIDEKNIYLIIENLEKEQAKDALDEYEKNNVKTIHDVIIYYEKVLNITLDSIKEYNDNVSISPSGNTSATLKEFLIKTIIALELSEQVNNNDKITKSVENTKLRTEHITTLKDFRDISKKNFRHYFRN